MAEDGKIWLPNLPSRALNLRSNAGHLMPTGYPACRVYFPGTYTDHFSGARVELSATTELELAPWAYRVFVK